MFKIFVPVIALGLIFSLLITLDGLLERTDPADAGVVLGSKVNTDGTPSSRLQARLDRSKTLLENKQISLIVVSGGTGKEGFSEALVMRDYLVAKGIPTEKILMDEQGNTTRATADNVAQMLKIRGMKSVIVISQYFHLTRSKMAFRQAGLDKVGSAYAYYFELRDFYSIAREVPAIVTYGLGLDSAD